MPHMLRLSVLASVLSWAALAPGFAQSVKPIELIVFPGGFNWPIWVAQEKGQFDRNGLAVTLTPTPSSAFLLTGLINGKFDIAMAGIDNVIAYMEGQGDAPTSESLMSSPSWVPAMTASCIS